MPPDPLYSISVHRRTYSSQCSDKIRFPQLYIKCGVAKSYPGTHTALQVPMLCSEVNVYDIVVSGRCGSLKYQNVAKTKLLAGNPLWASTLIAGLENAMEE